MNDQQQQLPKPKPVFTVKTLMPKISQNTSLEEFQVSINQGSNNLDEYQKDLSEKRRKDIFKETPKELPTLPMRSSDGYLQQDIDSLRAFGVEICDGSESVLEDHFQTTNDGEETIVFGDWGFSGECYRKQERVSNIDPKMKIKALSRKLKLNMDRGSWFLLMMPIDWLLENVLVAVNEELPNNLKIQRWELVRWMGIWFLLSATSGHSKDEFWFDRKNEHRFLRVPFTLNDLMTKHRFELINRRIIFTIKPKPKHVDKFHPILELQKAWNENMYKIFNPSWIVCLGESMSKCISKVFCPGFVFCPKKVWPFGNKWHAIACGVCSIIFSLELMEGKDRPKEAGGKLYDSINGKEQKRVGLLLRMTQSIFNSFRVVLMDNSFCLPQCIVELAKRGVFGAATMKNKKHWPYYINVDAIQEHFRNKSIGAIDALPGKLDNIPFHIFCIKEEHDIIMLISSYGTLEAKSETKRVLRNGDTITFKYNDVFDNHLNAGCAVENNNAQRMHPISLEETWETNRWEIRVFSFIMGVSASNAQFAYQYFGENQKESVMKFRRIMAKDLIYNKWVPDNMRENVNLQGDPGKKRKRSQNCKLITLPPYKKFSGSNLVSCDGKYNKLLCYCKRKRVRTYCICSPGIHRCNECYADHTQYV